VSDVGTHVELPPVSFAYREGDISLPALQKRVVTELAARRHLASAELAMAVIGLFAHTEPDTTRSAVARFNDGLNCVASADLNQYYVFTPPNKLSYRFRVGPFSIGPFDSKRLAYQCERAGSDYYARYAQRLAGHPLAVQRDHRQVHVLCWPDIVRGHAWQVRSDVGDRVATLLDYYYAVASSGYFEAFFRELDEVQEVAIALGAGWFDAERLRELIGAHFVSIYLNMGGEHAGFVSPAWIGFTWVDLGGAHLGIPRVEEFLKTHFGVTGFRSTPAHQMLRTYCHFLALAERHHAGGRHAEGFLHHVIALDLLLGEKTASTQSVARRSAILSHRQRGKSLDEAMREMERIYDARSRYVHAGIPPAGDVWDLVRGVCREVALCMLHCIGSTLGGDDADARDRWMLLIDHVGTALDLGRQPAQTDVEGIGVFPDGPATVGALHRILSTRASSARG
jgi:hypothetical protein